MRVIRPCAAFLCRFSDKKSAITATFVATFTEHGALMAANVLSSPQAVEASVLVVRTFVYLRRMLATNSEVAGRLTAVEKHLIENDAKIATISYTPRAASTGISSEAREGRI